MSTPVTEKPVGPTLERPFSSSPSLPAALPASYASVAGTRVGPGIFTHRLPASCCSHSISLLQVKDFQNSLIDFFIPPPPRPSFAVCVSPSKRGAVSLSHSNAPRLLDQRRVIDFSFKFSCSIRAPQSLGFKQRIMFCNSKPKKCLFFPPSRNGHPHQAAPAQHCPNTPPAS